MWNEISGAIRAADMAAHQAAFSSPTKGMARAGKSARKMRENVTAIRVTLQVSVLGAHGREGMGRHCRMQERAASWQWPSAVTKDNHAEDGAEPWLCGSSVVDVERPWPRCCVSMASSCVEQVL